MQFIFTLLLVGLLFLVPSGYGQQQLRSSDVVRVVSGPLNVRDAPGTGGEVTGQLAQGERAIVADDSPYWADGYWWWSITTDDGITGWVAEGDADLAYIAEVQADSDAGPGATPTHHEDREVQDTDTTEARETDQLEQAVTDTDNALNSNEAPTVVAVEPPVNPYAHLPAPIRAEREQIDSELGGFWVSVADYGHGPSRSGFAFSWGSTVADSAQIPHYWCDSGTLSNGPPFFERIRANETITDNFNDSVLRVDNLEVSCTESGGVSVGSTDLNRSLAFLMPAYQDYRVLHDLGVAGLRVAKAHTFLQGTLTYLTISGIDADETGSAWNCESSQSSTQLIAPLPPGVTRCTTAQEYSGSMEAKTLWINVQEGSILWEIADSE